MRSRSPYALDFYTAVVIFNFHEHWTEEEIGAEINRHLASLPYKGPHVKTIRRWLDLFRRSAETHTRFFVRQLREHRFAVPPRKPLAEQVTGTDYPSQYFLECICSLYAQLHSKAKNDCLFLWHANQLILSHFKSELFRPRPP